MPREVQSCRPDATLLITDGKMETMCCKKVQNFLFYTYRIPENIGNGVSLQEIR